MNLDLNSLPKSVLKQLQAKAKREKISLRDAAFALLSDRTTLALLSSDQDGDVALANRAIRRDELLAMVPLGHTTIYEMELRGEFPSRFYLTPRCAAWDLQAVLNWLDERQRTTSLRTIPAHSFPGINQTTQ